ncbi:hypothetical protein OIA45_45800 (plasmid) [Streptomyces chartreusis]|uniref:hypothetical protein n=1 Tax=Streptomyces chartreusis TaxID=1969 RepID=UPI003870A98B|nr:hypothetical protein OIA45_45800 [Streptomyces chartreusis]
MVPDSIEFPESARWILFVLLGELPLQASSDMAFERSTPFEEHGDRLLELRGRVAELMGKVDGALPPEVAARFKEAMSTLTDSLGSDRMTEFSGQFRQKSRNQVQQSQNIMEGKFEIIAEAMLLLAQLAIIAALSVFTGGLSFGETAAAKARSTVAVLTILDRLLRQTRLMPSLSEAVEEAFTAFAVRLAMLALNDGKRRPDGIDWQKIGRSAAVGALAGFGASVLSGSLLKVFKKQFDELGGSKWGRFGGDVFRSVSSEGPAEGFAEFMVNGLFDGKWKFSPMSLAGGSVSAVSELVMSTAVEGIAKGLEKRFSGGPDGFGKVNTLSGPGSVLGGGSGRGSGGPESFTGQAVAGTDTDVPTPTPTPAPLPGSGSFPGPVGPVVLPGVTVPAGPGEPVEPVVSADLSGTGPAFTQGDAESVYDDGAQWGPVGDPDRVPGYAETVYDGAEGAGGVDGGTAPTAAEAVGEAVAGSGSSASLAAPVAGVPVPAPLPVPAPASSGASSGVRSDVSSVAGEGVSDSGTAVTVPEEAAQADPAVPAVGGRSADSVASRVRDWLDQVPDGAADAAAVQDAGRDGSESGTGDGARQGIAASGTALPDAAGTGVPSGAVKSSSPAQTPPTAVPVAGSTADPDGAVDSAPSSGTYETAAHTPPAAAGRETPHTIPAGTRAEQPAAAGQDTTQAVDAGEDVLADAGQAAQPVAAPYPAAAAVFEDPVRAEQWRPRQHQVPAVPVETRIAAVVQEHAGDTDPAPAAVGAEADTVVRTTVQRIQADDGRFVRSLTLTLPVRFGDGFPTHALADLQERLRAVLDRQVNHGLVLPRSGDQLHIDLTLVHDPGHREAIELTAAPADALAPSDQFHIHLTPDSPALTPADRDRLHTRNTTTALRQILRYTGITLATGDPAVPSHQLHTIEDLTSPPAETAIPTTGQAVTTSLAARLHSTAADTPLPAVPPVPATPDNQPQTAGDLASDRWVEASVFAPEPGNVLGGDHDFGFDASGNLVVGGEVVAGSSGLNDSGGPAESLAGVDSAERTFQTLSGEWVRESDFSSEVVADFQSRIFARVDGEESPESLLVRRRLLRIGGMNHMIRVRQVGNSGLPAGTGYLPEGNTEQIPFPTSALYVYGTGHGVPGAVGVKAGSSTVWLGPQEAARYISGLPEMAHLAPDIPGLLLPCFSGTDTSPDPGFQPHLPAPHTDDPLAEDSLPQLIAQQTGRNWYAPTQRHGFTDNGYVSVASTSGVDNQIRLYRPWPDPNRLAQYARTGGLHTDTTPPDQATLDTVLRLMRALREIYGTTANENETNPDYLRLWHGITALERLRNNDPVLRNITPFRMDLWTTLTELLGHTPNPTGYTALLEHARTTITHNPNTTLTNTIPHLTAHLAISNDLRNDGDAYIRRIQKLPDNITPTPQHHASTLWATIRAAHHIDILDLKPGSERRGRANRILHAEATPAGWLNMTWRLMASAAAEGLDITDTDLISAYHFALNSGAFNNIAQLAGLSHTAGTDATGYNWSGTPTPHGINWTQPRLTSDKPIPSDILTPPWVGPGKPAPHIYILAHEPSPAGFSRLILPGRTVNIKLQQIQKLFGLLRLDPVLRGRPLNAPILFLINGRTNVINEELQIRLADATGRTVYFINGSVSLVESDTPGTPHTINAVIPKRRVSEPWSVREPSSDPVVEASVFAPEPGNVLGGDHDFGFDASGNLVVGGEVVAGSSGLNDSGGPAESLAGVDSAERTFQTLSGEWVRESDFSSEVVADFQSRIFARVDGEESPESLLVRRRLLRIGGMNHMIRVRQVGNSGLPAGTGYLPEGNTEQIPFPTSALYVYGTGHGVPGAVGVKAGSSTVWLGPQEAARYISGLPEMAHLAPDIPGLLLPCFSGTDTSPDPGFQPHLPAPHTDDPLAEDSLPQLIAQQTGRNWYAPTQRHGFTDNGYVSVASTSGVDNQIRLYRPWPDPNRLAQYARTGGLHTDTTPPDQATLDTVLRLMRALREIYGTTANENETNPDYLRLWHGITALERLRNNDPVLRNITPFRMDLWTTLTELLGHTPNPTGYTALLEHARTTITHNPNTTLTNTIPHLTAHLAISNDLRNDGDAYIRRIQKLPDNITPTPQHHASTLWATIRAAHHLHMAGDGNVRRARIYKIVDHAAFEPALLPKLELEVWQQVARAAAEGHDISNFNLSSAYYLAREGGAFGSQLELTGTGATGYNWSGVATPHGIDWTHAEITTTGKTPDSISRTPSWATPGTPTPHIYLLDGVSAIGQTHTLHLPKKSTTIRPGNLGKLLALFAMDPVLRSRPLNVPVVFLVSGKHRPVSDELQKTLVKHLGRTVHFANGGFSLKSSGPGAPHTIHITTSRANFVRPWSVREPSSDPVVEASVFAPEPGNVLGGDHDFGFDASGNLVVGGEVVAGSSGLNDSGGPAESLAGVDSAERTFQTLSGEWVRESDFSSEVVADFQSRIFARVDGEESPESLLVRRRLLRIGGMNHMIRVRQVGNSGLPAGTGYLPEGNTEQIPFPTSALYVYGTGHGVPGAVGVKAGSSTVWLGPQEAARYISGLPEMAHLAPDIPGLLLPCFSGTDTSPDPGFQPHLPAPHTDDPLAEDSLPQLIAQQTGRNWYAPTQRHGFTDNGYVSVASTSGVDNQIRLYRPWPDPNRLAQYARTGGLHTDTTPPDQATLDTVLRLMRALREAYGDAAIEYDPVYPRLWLGITALERLRANDPALNGITPFRMDLWTTCTELLGHTPDTTGLTTLLNHADTTLTNNPHTTLTQAIPHLADLLAISNDLRKDGDTYVREIQSLPDDITPTPQHRASTLWATLRATHHLHLAPHADGNTRTGRLRSIRHQPRNLLPPDAGPKVWRVVARAAAEGHDISNTDLMSAYYLTHQGGVFHDSVRLTGTPHTPGTGATGYNWTGIDTPHGINWTQTQVTTTGYASNVVHGTPPWAGPGKPAPHIYILGSKRGSTYELRFLRESIAFEPKAFKKLLHLLAMDPVLRSRPLNVPVVFLTIGRKTVVPKPFQETLARRLGRTVHFANGGVSLHPTDPNTPHTIQITTPLDSPWIVREPSADTGVDASVFAPAPQDQAADVEMNEDPGYGLDDSGNIVFGGEVSGSGYSAGVVGGPGGRVFETLSGGLLAESDITSVTGGNSESRVSGRFDSLDSPAARRLLGGLRQMVRVREVGASDRAGGRGYVREGSAVLPPFPTSALYVFAAGHGWPGALQVNTAGGRTEWLGKHEAARYISGLPEVLELGDDFMGLLMPCLSGTDASVDLGRQPYLPAPHVDDPLAEDGLPQLVAQATNRHWYAPTQRFGVSDDAFVSVDSTSGIENQVRLYQPWPLPDDLDRVARDGGLTDATTVLRLMRALREAFGGAHIEYHRSAYTGLWNGITALERLRANDPALRDATPFRMDLWTTCTELLGHTPDTTGLTTLLEHAHTTLTNNPDTNNTPTTLTQAIPKLADLLTKSQELLSNGDTYVRQTQSLPDDVAPTPQHRASTLWATLRTTHHLHIMGDANTRQGRIRRVLHQLGTVPPETQLKVRKVAARAAAEGLDISNTDLMSAYYLAHEGGAFRNPLQLAGATVYNWTDIDTPHGINWTQAQITTTGYAPSTVPNTPPWVGPGKPAPHIYLVDSHSTTGGLHTLHLDGRNASFLIKEALGKLLGLLAMDPVLRSRPLNVPVVFLTIGRKKPIPGDFPETLAKHLGRTVYLVNGGVSLQPADPNTPHTIQITTTKKNVHDPWAVREPSPHTGVEASVFAPPRPYTPTGDGQGSATADSMLPSGALEPPQTDSSSGPTELSERVDAPPAIRPQTQRTSPVMPHPIDKSNEAFDEAALAHTLRDSGISLPVASIADLPNWIIDQVTEADFRNIPLPPLNPDSEVDCTHLNAAGIELQPAYRVEAELRKRLAVRHLSLTPVQHLFLLANSPNLCDDPTTASMAVNAILANTVARALKPT